MPRVHIEKRSARSETDKLTEWFPSWVLDASKLVVLSTGLRDVELGIV